MTSDDMNGSMTADLAMRTKQQERCLLQASLVKWFWGPSVVYCLLYDIGSKLGPQTKVWMVSDGLNIHS